MNEMDSRIDKQTNDLNEEACRNPYENYEDAEGSWFWRYLPFWQRVKVLYNSMSSRVSSPTEESVKCCNTSSIYPRPAARPTSLMTTYSAQESANDPQATNLRKVHIVKSVRDNNTRKYDYKIAEPEETKDLISSISPTDYQIHSLKKEPSHNVTYKKYSPKDIPHEVGSRRRKSSTKRELNLWSLRKSLEADSIYGNASHGSPIDYHHEGGGDCSPCSTSSSERLRSDTVLTSDEDDERREESSSINEKFQSIASDRSRTPEYLYKVYTDRDGSPDHISPSTSGIQSSVGSCSSVSAVFPTAPTKAKSKKLYRQKNLDENKQSAQLSAPITSSSSLKSFTRIFRRPSFKSKPSPSLTFCGYSMERDYCVDVETDKIFKEYLRVDSIEQPLPAVNSRRLRRGNDVTQLRRQVMKKQYSDSVAMYYGQKMRRWRVTKQRSDSVNCPVDRGVLRRQAGIEEEFDPVEINERMMPQTSSRHVVGRYDGTAEERGFVFDDLPPDHTGS